MQLPDKEKVFDKKKFWGKGLLLFFGIMIFCTIGSRVMDSVTVARVTTGKAKSKRLSWNLEGTGMIVAGESKLVHVPGGHVVESGLSQGKMVKKGDVLMRFFMKELEEKKVTLDSEMEKLAIQLAQAELSTKPDAAVAASDGANRSFAQATDKYNQASAAYDSQYQQYQDELASLASWYKTESEKAYEKGDAEAVNALTTQYNEKIAALETGVETKSKEIEQAEEGLQTARGALEDAQKSDAVTDQNQSKSSQNASYTVDGLKVDVKMKEIELKKLQKLIEDGGKLYASANGTILKAGPEAGTTSSGSDFISIGTGGFELQGELTEEEAGKLQRGMIMDVTIPGGKTVKAEVGQINPPEKEEDEKWKFTALLEGEEEGLHSGFQVSFEMKQESDKEHMTVLPLTAIRQDAAGFYCLVAQSKSTILGEEYLAVRIPVTVTAKDSKDAAVSGGVGGEEYIIVGGSKNVEEGDRVRLEH